MICRFNAIHINTLVAMLTETGKNFYSIYGTTKDHEWPKSILRKNEAGDIILSDFKIKCKSALFKTWYWHKDQ